MGLAYLAVERDATNHEIQSKFWMTRNISAKRVGSIVAGINEAVKNDYLFIGINSSTVDDYKVDFSCLRNAANIPILISANAYDLAEHGKATVLGADLYGQLYENPCDNFTSITAVINRINDISKNHNCPAKILTYDNILMLLMQRQVFVGESQVKLTMQDYDLLRFFISNRNRALSYEEVYQQVWHSEYNDSADLVIKNAVTRLRKKLGRDDNDTDLVENLRNYGYICKEHIG